MKNLNWIPDNGDTPEKYLQDYSRVIKDIKIPHIDPKARPPRALRLEMQAIFHEEELNTEGDRRTSDSSNKPLQIHVRITDRDRIEDGIAPTIAEATTEKNLQGMNWVWPVNMVDQNLFRDNGLSKYVSSSQKAKYGVTFDHVIARSKIVTPTITITTPVINSEYHQVRSVKFFLSEDEEDPKLQVIVDRTPGSDINLSEHNDMNRVIRGLGAERPGELPLDHPNVKAQLEKLFPKVVIEKHSNQIFLQTLKDVLVRQRNLDNSIEAVAAVADADQEYFTFANSLNNPDNMRSIRVISSSRLSLQQGMESILRNVSGLIETHDLDLDAALQNVAPDTAATLSVDATDHDKVAILAQDIANKVVRRIELTAGPRHLQAARSEFFSRNVNSPENKLHPTFAAWQTRTSNIAANTARSADDQGKHFVQNIGDSSFPAENFGGRAMHAQKAQGVAQKKANPGPLKVPAVIEVDDTGSNAYTEDYHSAAIVAMTPYEGLNTDDSTLMSEDFARSNPSLITKKKRQQIYDPSTGQKKMQPASLENSHETRLHLEYHLGKSHADVKQVMRLISRHRLRSEKELLQRIRVYVEHQYPADADGNTHELVTQIRNLAKRKDLNGPGQTAPAIVRAIAKYHGSRSKRMEQYNQLDEHGLRKITGDPEKDRVFPGDILYAGYFMTQIKSDHWLYDSDRPEQEQGVPRFDHILVDKSIPETGAVLKEISRADPEQDRTYHHISLQIEKVHEDGDKGVPSDGSKGVFRIRPTELMPREIRDDDQNMPVDIVVNNNSPIARTSTAMLNSINWGNAAQAVIYKAATAATWMLDEQKGEGEPRTDAEKQADEVDLAKGIELIPWVLPGTQENNWKLLHAGKNGTPELPEYWGDFTKPEDTAKLQAYLREHEETLNQSALDPEAHKQAVVEYYTSLSTYPYLRVPKGIHGERKEQMERVLGIILEDGTRTDPSVSKLAIVDKEGNVTNEINAVIGCVSFVIAPQRAGEALNVRPLTSDARVLDKDFDPVTQLAVPNDDSTPSRIGLHEMECAKICGVGKEFAESVHYLRQRNKSQRVLAEFLAEPEEGFSLEGSVRKAEGILEKLHDTGEEENVEEQYFRDICFAAGFDWNTETSILSPISSREIRDRSMKQINNAADLRHGRDNDEQWGHIDFPTVVLHPDAQKSDRELGAPLMAAVLGMPQNHFRDIVHNPAVPDEERGAIPGTLRLMEMMEQFQARHLSNSQRPGEALDFNNPELIRRVIDGFRSSKEEAVKEEKIELVAKIEKQIQGLGKWAKLLENNARFDPMNYFLDSFPVLPNRLLQNFRQEHNKEAYYGNIEQSYQKLLNRVANLRNNDSPKSLRELNYAMRYLLNGQNYDKTRRSSETPNRKSVKGLVQRIVNKRSATYDILAGGSVASSGRGVIVPDPELLATQIRLPWAMASELCKSKLVHMLAEKNPDASPQDLDRMIAEGKQKVVEMVEQIFATRPIIAGRQPTLHSQNAQSFEVLLWKNEDGSASVKNEVEMHLDWNTAIEASKTELLEMLAESNPETTAEELEEIIAQGGADVVKMAEKILPATEAYENEYNATFSVAKKDDGSADLESDIGQKAVRRYSRSPIGWSPMNCPATNADFDGDAVWVTWIPVRRLAQRLHEGMNPYSAVNVRVARNLGPAITFGHECLDGICRTPTARLREILAEQGTSFSGFENKNEHSSQDIEDLMCDLISKVESKEITREQIAHIHRDFLQQGFHAATVDPVAVGSETAFRQIQKCLNWHYENILTGEFQAKIEPDLAREGAGLLKQSREDQSFRLPGSSAHSMPRKEAAIKWGWLHEEMKRFISQDMMNLLANQKLCNEIMQAPASDETKHLIQSCCNRARIKPMNLLKICFAVGLPLEKGGVPHDKLVGTPFMNGLSPDDMNLVRKASAVGNIESKDSVALGGYVQNSLRQAFEHYHVTQADCGTGKYGTVTSMLSDFKIAEGATLAVAIPQIPEIKVGDTLQPEHIHKLQTSDIREIHIRSVEECEATESIPTNIEDLKAGNVLGGKVLDFEEGHVLTSEDISKIEQSDAFHVRETSFKSREKGAPLEQKEESKVVGIRDILDNPANAYVLEKDSGGLAAGTKITPENILNMDIPELKGIPVRSNEPGACCQSCVGSMGTDPSGALVPKPNLGFHVGSYSATALTEPITQALLRYFHAGGTWNEMNNFGKEPVRTIQAGVYDTAIGQTLAEKVDHFAKGTELDPQTLKEVIQAKSTFKIVDSEVAGRTDCKTDGNRMLEYIQDHVNEEGKGSVSQKLALAMGNSSQFANRSGVFRFFDQATKLGCTMMNQPTVNQTDKASSGRKESNQPAPTVLQSQLTVYDRRDLNQKLREYQAVYDRKQTRLQKRIAREQEKTTSASNTQQLANTGR